MKNILLLLLFCFSTFISAQQIKVEGIVTNKSDGTPLSFATLKVLGTWNGVSSNSEGRYQLPVTKGRFKIAASFIGFISDTADVNITSNTTLNFELQPVSINLPEVTILPGINPALQIIRNAVEKKKQRADKISSYEYSAYTKGIIRSNESVEAGNNSVTLGAKKQNDSVPLFINGIFENQSKGYFSKPDKHKEFIIGQKQSSNFPSSMNLLTGGLIIQNFYSEDIRFLNRSIPGPISDDALDFYYYYITDTLVMDNTAVFKIYFAPDNSTDPGFTGSLFIKDSTFDMVQVDAELNRAANMGGIFDKVRIFQQFLSYNDIYMPIDYRLFVTANLLGLIRVGFEVGSVMYDYKINQQLDDGIFNKAIISVAPGADKKDSVYWASAYTIPSTAEEVEAYHKIDSVQAVPKSFWSTFTDKLLLPYFPINDSISVSSPLSIYHFNRVEGHALDFGIMLNNFFNRRLTTEFGIHYGFSDKKIKSDLNVDYYPGEYRTFRLSGKLFNKLEILFNETDNYNDLTATVLSLFSKYEFRDYYYTKGGSINISGDVFPVLNLGMGFTNRTDNTAFVNSDYSFFAKKKTYRTNPPVYETKINSVNFSFNFDFRNYIEDGYSRHRITEGRSYILFGGEIIHSNKDFLRSGLEFTKYNMNIDGILNTFRSSSLSYGFFGTYSDGPLPYQLMYALPGNIDGLSKTFSFRTVKIGEFFGDKVITMNLEHNFMDELFRMSRIPILKDSELLLSTYVTSGWTDISAKSRSIIPVEFISLKNPLVEAGFSLGHMLFPLKFEFTWRLNHKSNNPFAVTVNTLILM